jgi:integrase
MGHFSSRQPNLRQHKPSAQGVVTLNGKDHYLGKWPTGQRKPPAEVQIAYDRLIAEWLQSGRQLPSSTSSLSLYELILAYYRHAESYYRHPDGRPTTEVRNIRQALRWPSKLYGNTNAATFDSLALEAMRGQMATAGLCRNRINKDVARIKRMFKWAASQRLLSAEVYQLLTTVEGLKAGRSDAVESEPVRPVAWESAEQVLPFLCPQVAAMVQLQYHAGMRPGEILIMRTCDLDVSETVWRYTPGSDEGPHGRHKNAWRGHSRVILIGPRGQEVLRPWLRLNLQEYLFQPHEARLWWCAEQRKNRKTPMTPSQLARKPKKNAKRRPGVRYTTSSYCVAVANACEKAGIPHFHPNQLRHTKATEIRSAVGLDAARAVLGHRSPVVTEVYAEMDMRKAEEVMARLG